MSPAASAERFIVKIDVTRLSGLQWETFCKHGPVDGVKFLGMNGANVEWEVTAENDDAARAIVTAALECVRTEIVSMHVVAS